MFDIHCHILPGVDDGAPDMSVSLEMARAFADQGVVAVACTPHILPGIYQNQGWEIRAKVAEFAERIRDEGIALELVTGADNHMAHDFIEGLRTGRLLSLADGAYVLVEPPHHVAPARIESLFFDLQVAGYVPILTHPERLTWIDEKYPVIRHLAEHGTWLQITSGSLRGAFGRRPRYWAERLLAEGLVQVVASDAHNMGPRRPDLAEAFPIAERLVGAEEARNLFVTRPRGIVCGVPPHELPATATRSVDEDLPDHQDGYRDGGRDAAGGFARRLRRLLGG